MQSKLDVTRFIPRYVSIALTGVSFFAAVASPSVSMADPTKNGFNDYILQAVTYLEANYEAKGYGASAYTHPLPYGSATIKDGPKAPETMCVAAVAEVIVTALNIYMHDTGDKTPATYLPANGWYSMRVGDIKSYIWVDPRLESYGTADALAKFGVGVRQPFADLQPGSFINLNRDNKTGHAVVFLGFIDRAGDIVSSYDAAKVAGFKYFSSQGKTGAPGSGFGYKYAFFRTKDERYCPDLSGGRRVDCGVIYSDDMKMLDTGYMTMPSTWKKAALELNLKAVSEEIYVKNQAKQSPFVLPLNLSKDQFKKILSLTNVATLNPAYAQEIMPDDPK
jgi:hypothetical protein